MVMDVINVTWRNQPMGALGYDSQRQLGSFEYVPAFIKSGLEVSPLHMPLARRIYSFPALDPAAFKGLPGLLADSLPDDFANAVLNAWMSRQGRRLSDLTPLQRLQFTGDRGMGALGFHPATRMKSLNRSQSLALDALVEISQQVLDARQGFNVTLGRSGDEDQDTMLELLSVGTSAGGARAKAVLAFNKDFTQVRSGQVAVPDGFTHYLLKFDGVTEHRQEQETFGDPLGYSAMEYVYYLMALACGINMMPCRLLGEGKRRHFLTERFDRIGNDKIHIQSLNGIAHVSYRQPGSYSWEELFGLARRLQLGAREAEQLLRRLVFNIVARNHNDHAKNIGFVMQPNGIWQLAPAYDLAYSYKPGSPWVSDHWMTLNGRRDNFTRQDFYSLGKLSPLFSRRTINRILDETIAQVARWPELAANHDVPKPLIATITPHLRLTL